ncbi:transposon Ty3-G Gag-Pol polyprotein [Trichonephila inaurata madagascariensis]|uniref:Transposon Ty3-G Gag-Pol polyprotein n=1 Tax=Trichonephila inaurata madagascariensis TaxID=2747483 RepID=A0A8X6WYM3_9ARAC|nr:transposon Ty3-G Gag-Pol polyprotein [Trichonephila inaurata madagascariensis]
MNQQSTKGRNEETEEREVISSPCIPSAFRREIFERYHRTSHPGIRSFVKLISKKLFLPNLRRDVTSWSRGCIQCQKCKVSRHIHSQIGTYPLVSKPFDELNLHIIGSLPTALGYRYCVTKVDRFTRRPKALPVTDIRAETVANAVNRGWISKFGSPSCIVTDQGEKLRLPGNFLHDSKLASPSTFVQKLRNAFADLRPVLPSHHTKQKPFIFRFLSSCTHVFVHTDFVRTSLQPPYEGPYPVIMRYAKYLVIGMKRVSRTISIDRLKSCFFADPDPSKPTLDDKSSTTSTSPSTVPDTPQHSQQRTSEQPSKLRVRFAEPPAQYVTRSGRAILPSRLFL